MLAAEDPSENPPSHESVPSPLSQQEKSGVWARAAPARATTNTAAAQSSSFLFNPFNLFISKTSI